MLYKKLPFCIDDETMGVSLSEEEKSQSVQNGASTPQFGPHDGQTPIGSVTQTRMLLHKQPQLSFVLYDIMLKGKYVRPI